MSNDIRAMLVRAQTDARMTIHRGVVLIALVPLMLLGAVAAILTVGPAIGLVSLLFAAAYTFVGSIGGLATIAAGATEYRRVGREIAEIDEPRRLPAARLVVRR